MDNIESLLEGYFLQVNNRFREIETVLNSNTIQDKNELQEILKERAELEKLILPYTDLEKIKIGIKETEDLLFDLDLKALAQEELKNLREIEDILKTKVFNYFLKKEEGNAIVEIRAGAGGDEACLFVEELFNMYFKYLINNKLSVEIISSSEGDIGLKEIIFIVYNGYSNLKHESGVHRVQRVPETETKGRKQTSTVTVAVLLEVKNIQIKIEEKDLRIETMRAGGPGGQSVNTTDSAVQILHIPTKTIVKCQQEKSQKDNKATALRILQSKLYEIENNRRLEVERKERKDQIKTGDRAEKIRTYNFPDSRVTDHRINYSKFGIEKTLNGDIQELVDKLKIYYRLQELNK